MDTLPLPRCPRCGNSIPADAPQGLCPRCALAGAALGTEAGPRDAGSVPSIDEVRAAFPQLEVIDLIGRGGMGFVFKARQPNLDRFVALKLLPAPLAKDPAFVERFTREARALGRLAHPGIVSVYDFGQAGGFCYLSMEYVDGVNLRQAMQAGRFSPAEALAIVPKICTALQFAHDQGVLHRDIKPENILLDSRGGVKIADFGIAKLSGHDPRADVTLTQSGARLGTPNYMAPEQIEKPSEVDHRADIYSLGVVFYELLTGELPLGRFAPPSAKTELDARVDEIVMRALAKERELRQQSAGEVGTQVETVAADPHHHSAEGSAIQAGRAAAASWPDSYEYRSPRTLFGRPLVHVAFGRDPATGRVREARGIIAVGQRAVGVLAVGGFARGLLAFGGVAIGGIAFGGLGIGFLAFAGMALGMVSVGGLSVGLLLALGGGAIGLNAAGGLAIGKFAAGGLALGKEVWDAHHRDEAARWLSELVQSPWFLIGTMLFCVAAGVVPTLVSAWVQWHRQRGVPWDLHRRGAVSGKTVVKNAWRQIAPLVLLAVLAVTVLPSVIYLRQRQARQAEQQALQAQTAAEAARGPSLDFTFLAVEMREDAAGQWLAMDYDLDAHGDYEPTFRSRLDGTEKPVVTRMSSYQGSKAGHLVEHRRVEWQLLDTLDAKQRTATRDQIAQTWLHRSFNVRPGDEQPIFSIDTPTGKLTGAIGARLRGDPSKVSAAADVSATPRLATNVVAYITEDGVQHALETRTFSLHHAQADRVAKDLRQILLSRPGRDAKPGKDTTEVIVTAPADEMARAAALITVTDWPEPMPSLRDHSFTSDDPLGLARAFFYACAIEDFDSVEKALSDREFVELAGKDPELEMDFLGTKTAKRAADLHANWPQKDAAIRAFAAAWTRYPLRRLTLAPGIPIGFGERPLVIAAFNGAPKEFVGIRLLEQSGLVVNGNRALRWDSRPPWPSGPDTQAAASPRISEAERQKQDIQIRLARQRFEEMQKRQEVGAASPFDVATTKRELDVAEARGDALVIAQANAKHAGLALETARRKMEVGKLTTIELHAFEATNEIAQIELAEAERNAGRTVTGQRPAPNTVAASAQAAAVRLNLANQQLAELRKQAEVGMVAPRGREILSAELAVAVAEADLRGDAFAAAMAKRDHAEKVSEIAMKMNRAGKATNEELMRDLGNLATASADVSSALEAAQPNDTEQLKTFVALWLGKPAPAYVRDVRFQSDEGTAAEPRYYLRFHAGVGEVEASLRREGFVEKAAAFNRDEGPAWWRSAPVSDLTSYAREAKPAGCVVESIWWDRANGDVFYYRSCP